MASDAHKVVAMAGLVSVGVGSANSVLKDHRLPSSRFLIGSGVAYLILSVMADASPELAKGLSIGVATTVLFGEGGGVLSYISHGEIDTRKPTPKKSDKATPATLPRVTVHRPTPGGYRPDTPPAFPGLSLHIPTRP